MAATLAVTHKAIGSEVRRGPYEVLVDGERIGSVEMNDTISRAVEPEPHTLQVRSGRNSSRIKTFDLAEGEIASFRCIGKSILPIFLLPFAVSAVRRRAQSGPAGRLARWSGQVWQSPGRTAGSPPELAG